MLLFGQAIKFVMNMATDIDKFVHDQLSVWPAVAAKYRALKSARTRTLPIGGILVTLQSNPGRMPIFDHGCPLCEENYMPHQHKIPFEGRKGRKYNILVNRAPIFPNHLVITRDLHVPQTIWHRFPDMLDLAASLEGYLVFYNSPNSGTTVPGHAHFQACPKGYMPLERAAERLLRAVAAGESPEELECIGICPDTVSSCFACIATFGSSPAYTKHCSSCRDRYQCMNAKAMGRAILAISIATGCAIR